MSARDARRRTAELLEQFRLADRARADVNELSGGMAQRLMVARAIMHDPDVLFLDEPTSGLDPQSRLALWDVIGELHDAGPDDRAHDALHGGSRPAVRAGRDHRSRQAARARHAGRAEEVDRRRDRGAHPRVGRPRRRSRASSSRCTGVDAGRVVDGHRLRVRAAPTARRCPRSSRAPTTTGFEVHDVGIKETTLETVFIDLTGRELRE